MPDRQDKVLSDIGIAGFTITFGLTLPIAIVTSVLIYGRFRDNPTVTRRQLSLLTPTHVLSAICAFILQPWFLAVKCWPDSVDESIKISRITSYLIKVSMVLFILVLLLARFWVCYIENAKATQSQLWRQQLNPNRKSFVLDNYHTLGDTKVLYKWGFGIWLFFSLVQLVAALTVDFKLNIMISFIGFSLLILCAIVILYRLFFHPSDLYHIRDEFVAVMVGLSLVFLPLLIFTLITYDQNNERLLAALWDMNIIIALLLYYAITSATPLCAIAIQHYAIQARELSDGPEDVLAVLESERLYEAFSLHLTREFCIENLLFVVELIHFREYLLLSKKIDSDSLPKDSVLSEAKISKSVDLSPILLPFYEQLDGNHHRPESVKKKLFSVSQSMKLLLAVPEHSASNLPDDSPEPSQNEATVEIPNVTRPTSMSDPGVMRSVKKMRRSTVKVNPERAVEDIVRAIWSKYIGPKSQLMVNISGPVYHDLEASYNHTEKGGKITDVLKVWTELDRAGNETFKLLIESYSRFSYADVIDRID